MEKTFTSPHFTSVSPRSSGDLGAPLIKFTQATAAVGNGKENLTDERKFMKADCLLGGSTEGKALIRRRKFLRDRQGNRGGTGTKTGGPPFHNKIMIGVWSHEEIRIPPKRGIFGNHMKVGQGWGTP